MSLLCTRELSIAMGNKVICHHLNLTIHPGEVWGILGPNGSGKTTLLHTLAGLQTPAHGQVWLQGKPLTTLTMKSIAQTLGLLFQDFNAVFAQTVWEYCLAGRYPHLPYFQKENQHDQALVRQALQTMELDHLLQRRITQLSGGEKRRLAMAVLLAQTPQLYLLDEPTNHLDVRHQTQTLRHFCELAKSDAAVVMALHDINHAQQYCHRLLLMFADGSTLQGETRDVLTAENLSRLYEHPMTAIDHAQGRYWLAE